MEESSWCCYKTLSDRFVRVRFRRKVFGVSYSGVEFDPSILWSEVPLELYALRV